MEIKNACFITITIIDNSSNLILKTAKSIREFSGLNQIKRHFGFEENKTRFGFGENLIKEELIAFLVSVETKRKKNTLQ